MKRALLQTFKNTLTRIGANASDSSLHRLQMVVNYMRLGQWVGLRGFHVPKRLRDRTQVFDVVARQVQDREVLYLEFGSYRGKSMRYWSEALKNPRAQLHGFDSFEGLPEDFDFGGRYSKGAFDVKGAVPKIDDPRVIFHKGWFEDTVPSFVPPPHDVLVLCLDADLYSSTKTVFNALQSWIKPGTFIYFDDMSRPDHEPRAFDELIAETNLKFEIVAADVSLNTIFFVCVG